MFIKKSKYLQLVQDYEARISAANNIIEELHERYRGIEEIATEEAKLRSEYDDERLKLEQQNLAIIEKGKKLQSEYDKAYKVFQELKQSVELYNISSEQIDNGIYEPMFDFKTPTEFKEALADIINKEKELISSKQAVICSTTWTVDGSRSRGTSMTNKEIKLSLRAFNGECDAIIAKVKWNNIETCKKKIKDSYERINKLQADHFVSITYDYLKLKTDELVLTYEYELLNYKIKEEERERREERREEEKAIRELERERERAEEEEAHYMAALERVKKDIESATGIQYDKLSEKIQYLEEELSEARNKKERAISMSQQTRRGYVYIISNIGSFGENIYKIGMTRRLDPEDRIRELSNASVPFRYDIHAMIYSEDAPALETLLHNTFDAQKVNKINGRKEFFKVPLGEIESKIKEQGIDAQFISIPEARDFRETLKIETAKHVVDSENSTEIIEEQFPQSLFTDSFSIE